MKIVALTVNKKPFILVGLLLFLFTISLLWLMLDPGGFSSSIALPFMLLLLFGGAPGAFLCSTMNVDSVVCASPLIMAPLYLFSSLLYSLLPAFVFGFPVRGLPSHHFLIRHWTIIRVSYLIFFVVLLVTSAYYLLTHFTP